MAVLFLRLFLICQLHIAARLIQNLYERLIHDLLSAPNDAIDIGKRHANLLSNLRLSDPVIYKSCFQVKIPPCSVASKHLIKILTNDLSQYITEIRTFPHP